MFLRICRERDREGPAQDHTVSVRGRRCEIGLLAIINLWPAPPKYHGAGRVEQPGGGEPSRGKGGTCTPVCRLWTRKVNFPATGGAFKLMRSTRGWINTWRFFLSVRKGIKKSQDTCFCLLFFLEHLPLSYMVPTWQESAFKCILCKPWSSWFLFIISSQSVLSDLWPLKLTRHLFPHNCCSLDWTFSVGNRSV